MTNTPLVLPEYGRNIQNMVEIAKSLPDRAERNRCARSIIACMGNLFPFLRDNESFNHKLWDHLALMANFELDIDYPFEINRLQANDFKPDKIVSTNAAIRERHYGRFITQFIKRLAEDEAMTSRRDIALMIANYMKRCYNTYNIEAAGDAVIFNDLYRLSDRCIDLRSSGIKLQEMQNERRKNNDNKNKKNKH